MPKNYLQKLQSKRRKFEFNYILKDEKKLEEADVKVVKKTDQVKEEGMKEILSFFINVHDYRNYHIYETQKKQKRGIVHQSEQV